MTNSHDRSVGASTAKPSTWALSALFCSMAFFCPLLTLLGPLLGWRALKEIKSNPARSGRGMAVSAIVLGAAFTLMSTLGWWRLIMIGRPMMLHGPQSALRAGFAGDLAEFKDNFTGDGADASDAEAQAFVNQLEERYGPFINAVQKSGTNAAPSATSRRIGTITYELHFQQSIVEADVELILFADWLAPRLRFIHIKDPSRGDLTYPVSAAPSATSAHSMPSP